MPTGELDELISIIDTSGIMSSKGGRSGDIGSNLLIHW